MCPLFFTSWLAAWALLVPPSATCLEDLLSLPSTFVQSPFGIFAFSESFPEVILFFLEQLWIAAHCGGPVGEGLDDTKLGWEVMACCPTVVTGSVCKGFLYTAMDREPSTSGLTIVSKKGMQPSSLLSSTVNLMAGSTLFMCWRKPCLLASLWMTKVSSTYLHQNLGGGEQYLGLFALSTPCINWLLWG